MATERYLLLLITALMLNACAPAVTGERACSGQQIIISFAPGVDVRYPGFTAGLSRDAGVPIEYIRHLFSDHYLYCAQQGEQGLSFDEARQRLQGRADIQAVEIDRLKHPGSAQ
jgi:hypothetical protein